MKYTDTVAVTKKVVAQVLGDSYMKKELSDAVLKALKEFDKTLVKEEK